MTTSDTLWELTAPLYRILRKNPISGYYLKRESRSVQLLLQHLELSKLEIVCDLGVGRGHSLDLILNTNSIKIALDKSAAMVRLTSKKYISTKFLVGDALHLPLKSLSIDLMICIGLIEYLSNIDAFLSQMHFSLKDDGYLLLTSSPKNVLTSLRVFTGHKLIARNPQEMEDLFKRYQFTMLEKKLTPLQDQYLLSKNIN
jgi:ubiquinone/menaquinone biosynthesis C-methylase UbiE